MKLEICKLEQHILDHDKFRPFECEKCNNIFVIMWRLIKHINEHEPEFVCHHFNNRNECPFDKIGCKFRHGISTFCQSRSCNKFLCPYRYVDEPFNKGDISDKQRLKRKESKQSHVINALKNPNAKIAILMDMLRTIWASKQNNVGQWLLDRPRTFTAVLYSLFIVRLAPCL